MVVCLYNTAPNRYLSAMVGASSTVERVAGYVEQVSRSCADAAPTRVLVYATAPVDGLPGAWSQQVGPPLTQAALVELLAGLTVDAETEILFAFLELPFLNSELTCRMLRRHRDYRAEYTFADGYPSGLAPELVSGRAVSHLRALASATEPVVAAGLFPIVQKDINRLDVETELSPTDQRLLRLRLAVNTRADLTLCSRLAADAPDSIDAWPAHVAARHTGHRTLPRFVSVQVIEQEVQRLAYSPYPTMRPDALASGSVMSLQRWEELVAAIDAYAPEAVVQLSLWGEIALHPDAVRLCATVLASEGLSLLVETSGVGWSEASAGSLFELAGDRMTLIVGLDTNDEATYRAVRGDGFAEAQRFAIRALEAAPGQTYVQAVRSELTESTLDEFYRTWKERTDQVIIQKYDHFSGRLPDRKIGDISPLVRFPCWHLQRDLYVLVDGEVPLCREDVFRETTLGNVFSDGMEAVWERAADRYAEHVDGTYHGICEVCDEYYTFNF